MIKEKILIDKILETQVGFNVMLYYHPLSGWESFVIYCPNVCVRVLRSVDQRMQVR